MRQLIFPYTNLRISPSLRCNFNCEYCTQFKYQKDLIKGRPFTEVSPDVWIKHIGRIKPTRQFRITLGSGEPTLYQGISDIINSFSYYTLLYTNGSDATLKELKKTKARDNLFLYVSYHPMSISCENFMENAKWIKSTFKVMDFHCVPYSRNKKRIVRDKKLFKKQGLTLNTNHPLIGWFDGELYFYDFQKDEPRFRDRIISRLGGDKKTVFCKMSHNHTPYTPVMSYPVAPNGDIYICWRYLLARANEGILGNFFDEDFQFSDGYLECPNYGDCNTYNSLH